MKFNYRGITIFILEDYNKVSKKAAQLLSAQITLKSNSVLGLATGSTPEGMYKELIDMYNDHILDFSEVTTFNLDEYYNIDPNNSQSYHYYMNTNLFNHVNIDRTKVNIPSGKIKSSEVDKFCNDYDDSIFKCGKIDFQVLGIGTNGHIGFNEPDIHFEAGTHLVDLDQKTIDANARFFNSTDEVPKQAISIGIRNIMQSKKVMLMASGSTKASVIDKMIFGEVTPHLPASILQVHNDVTIIVDKEAGSIILDKLNKI